jgi:hypothetical protein
MSREISLAKVLVVGMIATGVGVISSGTAVLVFLVGFIVGSLTQ